MASFDEFYESLPEDSNKRGEYFEKVFVPWFLKTDPEWSTQVQQIWLWDDYPHRWGKDCGIDLVYEDPQGKHWAVQSKCVSPDREISKAEIDSFLSESSDPRIHGRLLIASTDGIGKNAQQVIDRQEKQVVCFLLDHFRHSEVDFPSSPEDLSTGQRKEKRTPRPHQQEAIKNVVEGFHKEDRGQLLMACGTGKTLTSLWIKEALNVKRTLVLVPSLSLLSQTLREWTATSQQQFNWICVCSDKSVAKQDKTTDNMIERVSGLGVPVTSDPKDIQDFLSKEEGGVVFSTYQSSELVAESQKNQSTPLFDITFADEAHRCTGKISSAFACVLDGEHIRSDKRLFMTATPRVLSKQIKKRADDENITLACMDDSSLFGKVFHQLNFSEAIEKELLSDYQVVIIGVDDPYVEAKIINRSIVETGAGLEIDTETLANHIALAKAVKDYDLSRIITFHSRVKSAKRFSEVHPSILDWIPEESKSSKSSITSYVSGEMNTKTRNTEINKLRNISEQEVGILANARCLSEGVDVPTLDGIAFFAPKSSQVDIIQAVGRAIRKSEDKTDGYIILPVYLGDTTNAEDEILQSRFKDIWNIVLALKSQDDSFRETLDNLRIDLGKKINREDNSDRLGKIIFNLPSNIPANFIKSIKTLLVKQTTENWMEKYGELIQYTNDNRTAKVPRGHPSLGAWVSTQRKDKSKGRISKTRIQLLEQVGFTWNPYEEEWQEKYQLLKDYLKHKGDTRVPQSHPNLGAWVSTQRKEKSKGRMPKARIQLLEQVGFTWDPNEEEWQENFEKYKTFISKNHTLKVPRSHTDLGAWVSKQRLKKSKGKLTKNRINLLDEAGFLWDPYREEWQEYYNQLKEHYEQKGNTYAPVNDPKLQAWVNTQRASAKNNKLPIERKQLLEEIKFIWDVHESQWTNKYAQLKEYYDKNGNSNISTNKTTLGRWVQTQRAEHSKGLMPKERIKLLEKIDFTWDVKDSEWQKKYQLLKDYLKHKGDTRVPKSHPTLGAWVSNQRTRKKEDRLTKSQIKMLDEIGFIWDASNN